MYRLLRDMLINRPYYTHRRQIRGGTQFGCIYIYSDFAPSATGSGASVSQPKNLNTTFQFKFALEVCDVAFAKFTIRDRSVINACLAIST